MKKFDAIIIGAGVVGCTIARSLSMEGLKTLNIDTLPAPGYGSTSYSSAIIRPFYSHTAAAALAHEARSHWLDWENFIGVSDERGFAKYKECGLTTLLVEGEENAYDANLFAMNEAGVNARHLSIDELNSQFPGISFSSFGPPKRIDDPLFGEENNKKIIGAIHVPEAGYVNDPQLASYNLFMAAKQKGAEFRFNEKVIKILKSENKVEGVGLKNGDKVFAPIIVNASGPHSFKTNQMAGIEAGLALTTKALRHEVTYLEAPSSNSNKPVLIDLDAGVYLRPDGVDLLVGSLDPSCDGEDRVDPDDYNKELTEQWTNQAWRAGLRFDKIGIPNTARGAVALYDVSNDWVPLYDKSDLEGFFLAIGTSGNQFKNAPMIGELMTKIILGVRDGVPHDETPITLPLKNIGLTINLGHYSRLREINETSNVMA